MTDFLVVSELDVALRDTSFVVGVNLRMGRRKHGVTWLMWRKEFRPVPWLESWVHGPQCRSGGTIPAKCEVSSPCYSIMEPSS